MRIIILSCLALLALVACGSSDVSTTANPLPVASPTPLNTLEPTSASGTCPNPQEAAYFNELSEELERLGSGLTDISAVMSVAALNLTPQNAKDWALEAAIPAGTVSNAINNIKALSPPPSAQGIHDLAKGLADRSFVMVSLYIQGLDTFDAAKIASADEAMAQAGRLTNQLLDALIVFCHSN